MIGRFIKISAACAVAAFTLSGCASIEDVEHAQATADQALAQAQSASSAAAHAQSSADSAGAAAARAQASANAAAAAAARAQSSADAAGAAAAATDAKLASHLKKCGCGKKHHKHHHAKAVKGS